jgi:hypothetical protein
MEGGRERVRIINGTVGRPTILGPLVTNRSPGYRFNLNSRELHFRRTIKQVGFVEQIKDARTVATANKYSALSVA